MRGVLLVLLAALPFLPGLAGPFLLDDLPNFAPLWQWARGEIDLGQALTAFPAGPFGRPVSLLSFLANLAVTGASPLSFKATNLLIHLASGVVVALLLERLLRQAEVPRAWAWAAAALWVVLPLHVPIVLYAVQRMSLLAGLFMFLGLLAYASARERLQRAQAAGWRLWLAVPAFTVLAALSKENGLLTPLLCLVLELTLFRPRAGQPRPQSLGWFFRLFLFWPTLIAAAWLATHPAYLLEGYADRPFSFFERVASQPRALWAYAWTTFVPTPAYLGIFLDAFPLSQGWREPASTVPALAGWIAAVGVAVLARKHWPLVTAGIGIFLAGHAMESSILPLEPFFLHRNYVPSLGCLLAGLGVASPLARALARHATARRWLFVLPILLGLQYAAITARQSHLWSSRELLLASELRLHPDSLRLRSDLALEAMTPQRSGEALAHLDAAARYARPQQRRAVRLWTVMAACSSASPPGPALLASLHDDAVQRIGNFDQIAVEALATDAEAGYCGPETARAIAGAVEHWLARTPQSQDNPLVWKTRYAVARLYAISGDLEAARRQAVIAFESSWQFPVGAFAFQLSAALDDLESCAKLLDQLKRLSPSKDPREKVAIDNFERHLRQPLPSSQSTKQHN